MSDQNNQDKSRKSRGFSGLSSMVTDVSSIEEHDAQPSERDVKHTDPSSAIDGAAVNEPNSEQRTSSENETFSDYRQTRKPLSPHAKWLIGGLIVVGLIWLLNSGGKTSGTAQQSYIEDLPPVGSGLVLTTPQVRYCVSENIRLDALNQLVDPYNHARVDLYNTFINDYNSRCSNYKYRSGVLESVKKEAEARRFLLEQEGRSYFVSPEKGSVPSASGSVSASPPTVAHSPVSVPQRAPVVSTPKGNTSEATPQRQPTYVENESIEAACNTDKYVNGPAAYNNCVKRHRASLNGAPLAPDLSNLDHNERESIEAACNTDKYVNGPAAYNRCLNRKFKSLKSGEPRPDLSSLTYAERDSIESSCSVDKYVNGPAAYNNCLKSKLSSLQKQKNQVDLSKLSYQERERLENICSVDKYANGPAAYNQCLKRNLRR